VGQAPGLNSVGINRREVHLWEESHDGVLHGVPEDDRQAHGAKLKKIRQQLRERLHEKIEDTVEWLQSHAQHFVPELLQSPLVASQIKEPAGRGKPFGRTSRKPGTGSRDSASVS